MAKQPKNELVVIAQGFDYSHLAADLAKRVQSAAERIRERVKRTLDDVIETGNDLLSVKEGLPHGEFGTWLKAEFGWGERMAQHFINVAERFGKTEIISDLKLSPTAAYLLAAPSVPDEARQVALDRAEAGEQITTAVAKKIVAEARKTGERQSRPFPADKRAERVKSILERIEKQWGEGELAALAAQLREFADELEASGGKRGGRKKGKS